MTSFPAVFDLSSLDGTNGFKINGQAAGEVLGERRLADGAGDINGDGFDDLIVGADGTSVSYVIFGKAGGFVSTLELSSLDGGNGFRIVGEPAFDLGRLNVDSAGDVNGDGFDDLILGFPLGDPHGSRSGVSYIVFGKAAGFDASLDLSGLDGSNGFQINGKAANQNSGWDVDTAGDVNGDGFDDVIIGSYGSLSENYIVFGKAGGFTANFNLSSLDGTNGFRLTGKPIPGELAKAVASAGDVNGDGFGDVITGALFDNPNGQDVAGTSYVIFGNASGFSANET